MRREGEWMKSTSEARRLAQRAYNALCTAAGDLIRAEQALPDDEKEAASVLSDAYGLAVDSRIRLAKFSHPEAAALYEEMSAPAAGGES